MSELVLRYSAPVYVTVDLDGRCVVRVECADTETELELAAEAPVVVDGDGDPRTAAQIAEVATWPEWRFI